MLNTIFYTLISVLIISLISFIGIFTIPIKKKSLKKSLIYLISFSAGALFGDAFFHLLPETIDSFTINTSISILSGIIIFFVLEKIIHWQHCHTSLSEEKHIHPFAYTNLVGDALHNLIDGVIIATGFIINVPVGIATTMAVALHEIPQEIGDFSILLHAGFTKAKALLMNFASALFAFLGVILTLKLSISIENIEQILVPITIGGFIYIAGSDLIPELHKHSDKLSKNFLQLISFILGILIMAALLLLE